jgi:hypothetical protein
MRAKNDANVSASASTSPPANGGIAMNRRQVLAALLTISARSSVAATPSVSTLIGNGSRGYFDHEVNNPYGL